MSKFKFLITGEEQLLLEYRTRRWRKKGGRITNQPALRDSFWETHPEFKRGSRKTTQNDYSTDIRCAWVAYVDLYNRDGVVSDKLSQRATL